MASSTETYCYDGNKPFTLVKWKVKIGVQVMNNSVILTYKPNDWNSNDIKEPQLKYKSNIAGTVTELLVKEGDMVCPGAELLKVEPCTHPVIMKDLCAECGADLRSLDRDNFEKLTAATTFSMVHVVPELKVSREQAEKLGQDDENRLLTSEKLVLLVDLDQTLIHTTNDNVPQNLPDVHHFQLYGSYSPWYHTKLRPGTKPFLENIAKYYELHICTFGARLYAHKIAQILDPDGKLFSHRILSRDECFDATSKTGNLKALFPRGDNMVCIIDDREDVWNFAPNVIHVKPYGYFRNTGDINAPPPVACTSKDEVGVKDTSLPDPSNPEETVDDSPSKCDTDSAEKQNGTGDPDAANKEKETPSQKESEDNASADVEVEDPKGKNPDSTSTSRDINNVDDYLLYLEEILVTVHKRYYDRYAKIKKNGEKGIPDLKVIVPEVRRKVLRNINIVFSSVIPTNCVPESHHFWTLAERMGARVTRELELGDSKSRTTHVVASKQGTAKVNTAKKQKNIHIVSLDWLLCCSERWEHADERLFPLPKDAPFYTGEGDTSFFHGDTKFNKGGKRPHYSKQRSPREVQNEKDEDSFSEKVFIEAGLSLSQDDIEDMDREIDEACSEESDDGNQNESSSSSSTSIESLSSGDYPKGWKRRKKCEDSNPVVADDGVGESSDAETIGSVDEEIADAVKAEFGNF